MVETILQEALEEFRESEAGSSEIRTQALDDIKFARLGDQWPEAQRKQRELDGRPCLTINRLPTFIRQVVNDARQNKPGIKVHPVSGGADPDTAEVIGGLVRAIERGSNAALAYDTAIDNSASCGFGFFRITTDYCHPMSFDQELRINRVANPFSVHWDVSSLAFDASDWSYAFVSEVLTGDEFKRRYPKDTASDWQDGLGEDMDQWVIEEGVRVAEYWRRTAHKKKILRLTDGSVVEPDDLERVVGLGPDGQPVTVAAQIALMGLSVNAERETTFYKVKRRMISGADVLSEEDWPGSTIPICPVWGEEVIYRGKRHFRSLIRDARDPQAMMNFWRSASTELVALAPRAPWLVATGSIPDEEKAKWETANTRSHAYLEYDPSAGPAPQRQAFAGVPAGALQEALNAQDDMKSIIGIFDASLGARSNETSGRAIMARQREADKGTFHFIDNMARAIQSAGQILIECIPHIYSERQTIQTIGEDNREKVVRLVAAHGEPPSEDDPDGKIYDLSTGEYSVTVQAGPNYATQREETVAAMTELIRAYPAAAEVLGDLWVENMDWPGAESAAERIQIMQFMRGVQMGIPQQALAGLFPEVAKKMGPMPMPQPMQGAPAPGGM